MRVLILQHIACEPPGAYEEVLHRHEANLVRVELDQGEPLPDWREFYAIVAMGGPMDTFEEDRFPWLSGEKRLIADAVRAGKPFWGVCLGAQLLADALGARVYTGAEAEIGVLPIFLTPAAADDPITSGLPRSVPAFHWHGCGFDLPDGATLLAYSQAYRHQIFRVGDAAYGVQCHFEASAEQVRLWLEEPAYADSLAQTRGASAEAKLLAELAASENEIHSFGRTLFERWLTAAKG